MSEPTDKLSFIAKSNIFTKSIAAAHDARQAVLAAPGIPNERTKRLLAQLILEEALETIEALGAYVDGGEIVMQPIKLNKDTPNEVLEQIVDGCCDIIYVATGCLVACGVPDLPHLAEVCRANNEKFPNALATMHPKTGKFLKPAGWKGPDHITLFKR